MNIENIPPGLQSGGSWLPVIRAEIQKEIVAALEIFTSARTNHLDIKTKSGQAREFSPDLVVVPLACAIAAIEMQRKVDRQECDEIRDGEAER